MPSTMHRPQRWIALLAFVGCGLLSMIAGGVTDSVAQADDQAGAMAVMTNALEAYNAGDVERFFQDMYPKATSFGVYGDRLGERPDREVLSESFAAGYKTNLKFEGLEIVLFDDAACVTSYLTGAVTLPAGEPESVVWRLTAMLVKKEGKWKMVHLHGSSMASEG